MRRVTLLTDAPLFEKWFVKGTVFVVREGATADAEPLQVDPRTADAWVAQQWARGELRVVSRAKAAADVG